MELTLRVAPHRRVTVTQLEEERREEDCKWMLNHNKNVMLLLRRILFSAVIHYQRRFRTVLRGFKLKAQFKFHSYQPSGDGPPRSQMMETVSSNAQVGWIQS